MPSKDKLIEIIRLQSEICKQGLHLGGVMTLVTEGTLQLVGADGAAIEIADGGEMVFRAAAGTGSIGLGLRVDAEHSLSGLCMQLGVPLRCDDAHTDERVDREACRRLGLRSMVVIPLKHADTTVGVLKAFSSRPGRFNDGDMLLLSLLSELVGAAMYHAARYQHDALFHSATHDPMTGLANRGLFIDRLRSVLSQGRRTGRPFGLLVIDMDRLKSINDAHGHAAGDAALKELARRIDLCARASDTVARLGGDEFGVILTPIDGPTGLGAASARIRDALGMPFRLDGSVHDLSASIGAACYPDDGDEPDDMIQTADRRMYAAKLLRQQSRAH